MRASKEKNLKISTSPSSTTCFSSFLRRIACGASLASPTLSNGCIHPDPNVSPISEPTTSNPAQPGLVARLMGLESMPVSSDTTCLRDSVMNLRSKSLNSLHWYIFPDTFLDHVSPSPCHRRTQTTSSVLCVEPSPSLDRLEDSVVNKKTDHRTRKCLIQKAESSHSRVEIKNKDVGMKPRREKRECRVRKGEQLKLKVHEKRTRSRVSTFDHCKDESARRRRRPSRKDSRSLQGEKMCKRARKKTIDCSDWRAQTTRLTEEDVKGDEWIEFDENVKELGVGFAGEMLEVLINQFIDELIGSVY